MYLPSYNSRLITIWDIASDIFFILFPIGLGFLIVFIFYIPANPEAYEIGRNMKIVF